MPPPAADELFQVAMFVASTCAAIFWFCSATGQTVVLPWRHSEKVPPEGLSAHQAKWNARAAASSFEQPETKIARVAIAAAVSDLNW
jgi:hypothetical protein